MADINRLIEIIQKLVSRGNTVIVIEHNLDVALQSDWIIDVGPEGGNHGGEIVAQGTPEQVASVSRSHTARFLRDFVSPDHSPYLTPLDIHKTDEPKKEQISNPSARRTRKRSRVIIESSEEEEEEEFESSEEEEEEEEENSKLLRRTVRTANIRNKK
jgi:excinuclease ABC subunit A